MHSYLLCTLNNALYYHTYCVLYTIIPTVYSILSYLLCTLLISAVNVFSPLDYTTTVTNRPLSDAPSTATRTSDPSVVTTTQSSAPTTRSATPRQVSPQGHKKPGSPHMKRNTSPTVSMETTKV